MKDKQPAPATQPVDAETINAVVDALGGLVMSLARRMAPADKAALANDLAQLSANATAIGNTATGRLMSDLSRAASM